jgi:nucleoside-diphosphate-sugar epimerase
MAMKVLVTGATGVAGQGVVPALVAAGHEVTAVSRSPAKAQLLRAWGATPLAVDVFDPMAAERAVKGQDAVCNLATHIPSLTRAGLPGAWRENDRIRRVASANLVDAALADDVAHFVQESIALVYPDRGDEWITEQEEPRANAVTRSALVAEKNVALFTGDGRTGVVLRFAQFYGTGAVHSVQAVRVADRFGIAPTIGDPQGYLSSIHRDDLGPAVAAALRAPAGVYNVGDDRPVRRRELHAVMAQAVGRERLREWGPLVARLGGRRSEPVARSQRLSNTSFKRATGWQPTVVSALEGWPPIIAGQLDR